MRRCKLFILLVVLTTAPAAETDTASGTFTVDGNSVELRHAYLQTEKYPFDPSQTGYIVTLSDVVIEPELLTQPSRLPFHTTLHYVQVHFDSEYTIYSVSMHHPAIWDGNVSGGGAAYKLELEKLTPDFAGGRAYLEKKSCWAHDDNKCSYDISFQASLIDEKQMSGEPLGEGGGEPGHAYTAFLKTIADGDVGGYRQYLSEEGSASFTDEQFIAGLPMLQAMTPDNVKVIGGKLNGDTGLLDIKGEEDGKERHGIVTMRKIGNRWIHEGVKWDLIIIE